MADGMMHFVSDYAKKKVGDDPAMLPLVMGYYGAQQLPVYDMLARSFAICDHWFCSHVGPTWPNRFVTLTGDLNRDSYGEPEVDTPDYADFTPSEGVTLFDLLSERGVSWQYFQQRASIIRAFTKYSFDLTNVLEFDDPLKGFAASARAGLKSVTFVDPLFGDLPAGVHSPQDNDDAPPSDLKDGQAFIDGIVRTLFTPASNPNLQKTMLIVVYDEHGGFYDHVDPPSNFAPLLGQNSGKLGPRVPAFVVSHWTPVGVVLKDTFDHTTIAATILRRFCSPHPPVMSPRVTAALDLRGALSLARPRGELTSVLGTGGVTTVSTPMTRTVIRRFKTPRAPDSNGAFLGGMALMLGATPR
jgi:phospholipase C